MAVILTCVTSVESPALRAITSPDVDCVSSLVVAGVTDGVSATALTVIDAVALGPSPVPVASSAPATANDPVPEKLDAGVNFNPALPSANVMKPLLPIWVVPSCLKSVPLVIAVILNCVTSVLSAAFREITRPDVVCVSSVVVALVTDGVSAIGVTEMDTDVPLLSPPPALSVPPCAVNPKLEPGLNRFDEGVNFRPA